ncbi:MAG: U32 family peptidase [Actinomycetota bacterium]|nr:U32 family peptidase [Actinomycetota bacterium]
MKISAPTNKVEEVEELINEGADELYCGVAWKEWSEKYTIAAANRRANKSSNLSSFDELRRITDIAHSYDVPVSFCVNEHYYIQEQYPLLQRYLQMAIEAGVDSLMIADAALILTLREAWGIDIPIAISTGGATFNSEAARFYHDLGASRITLPRHLKIGEIRDIVCDISGLETSVFILNIRCANIDGLCTFDHTALKCPEPAKLLGEKVWSDYYNGKSFPPANRGKDPVWTNACMLPYIISLFSKTEEELSEEEETRLVSSLVKQGIWDRAHIDNVPCGVCALYEFEEMGVDYAKIVGRDSLTSRKIGDIRFIRIMLSALEDEGISREEYRKKARELHRYHYGVTCQKISCYYPEVLSEEASLGS